MLHAGRDLGASLQTILEENPDSESQGSTEPLAETFTKQPPLLPFRGGAIFNVSIDSPPRNGETDEERAARENRNANRAQRRDNERAIAMAEAARDNQIDSQGRPLHRNLNEEFLRVDGHDVFKTLSANLAVAANELAHLPQTPELAKVAAMLKAAHCQVNEIREVQRPSCSTSAIRRSVDPRSNRRPSQSRFADQSPPPQGGVGGHRAEHHRQHDQEVE